MACEGSRHRGRVVFEVHDDIEGPVACDCPISAPKGPLMGFVPRERPRLPMSERDLAARPINKLPGEPMGRRRSGS